MNDLRDLESEECGLIGKIEYMKNALQDTAELAQKQNTLHVKKSDLEGIMMTWPSTIHTLSVSAPAGTMMNVRWAKKKEFQMSDSNDDSKINKNEEKVKEKILEKYEFELHLSNKKNEKPLDVYLLSHVDLGPSTLSPHLAKHKLLAKHKSLTSMQARDPHLTCADFLAACS